MLKDKLDFTDHTVYTSQILKKTRKVTGPVNTSWTRVKVVIPDAYSGKKVEEWVEEHLTGPWFCYQYHNRAFDKKANGFTMIFRFKDKNDALMFKLQGGHQAYQEI